MNPEKEVLRSKFKIIRKNISVSRKEEAKVKCYLALQAIAAGHLNILSYNPLPDEIDISRLNNDLAKEKKLLLPKIGSHELKIFKVLDTEKELISNPKFAILEPNPSSALFIDNLDIISLAFIPSIAFDKKNHRLGFGSGYYDRLLSKLKNCRKIGVGFKEQLYNGYFPISRLDIPLDEVLLF